MGQQDVMAAPQNILFLVISLLLPRHVMLLWCTLLSSYFPQQYGSQAFKNVQMLRRVRLQQVVLRSLVLSEVKNCPKQKDDLRTNEPLIRFVATAHSPPLHYSSEPNNPPPF